MQYIFKTSCRNFVRRPITNMINLLGLAVSLALVIFLSVYSYSELTTDNYHVNGDHVYLYADLKSRIYTPGILKEQIDLNVPDVESTVRIAGSWEPPVFQVDDNEPITSDILFADVDFFKLFTYKASEGNLESALKEPMMVVITKKLSNRLFGNTLAVGKSIKLNNNHVLTVSAVIEEPNANSFLSGSAITSIATSKIIQPEAEQFTNWGYCSFHTFLLLKTGTNSDATVKSIYTQFPDDRQKEYAKAKLIPLRNIYFSGISTFGVTYLQSGDKRKVMILFMVAAMVLLIALVNFINISSSQWMEKIRQTGVLKVIGADKTTILKNILFETFILFLMSLFLAILILQVMHPLISNYTGIHFNSQLLYKPIFLLVSIAGTFILSLILSIIPALRISSSKAIDNLKKNVEFNSTNSIFSGMLVTAQFVIAIALITFTMLVQKQINFGRSTLGFNHDNIIGIKLTPQLDSKKGVLKKLLEENPAIKNHSFTQYFPGKLISTWWGLKFDIDGESKELNFNTFCADASFMEILGLKLTTGRFYSKDISTDRNKVVVNEAFVRQHKITNPIGAKFFARTGQPCEIIGVVKNFHYIAVNTPIDPLAIRNEPDASICLVSLQTASFNNLHRTIQEIRKAIAELSPSFPVEISFFDQAIENMYQSELQFQRTFSLFAGCAIVICCMGILAMSLFTCQHRIKEIGIRKVNGAKISEVMTMLNKDFVRWVAIAFVIACPIAYYAMSKWLENFAYKTELSWWVFALAGLMALAIALITVSWQSWKAATRNPVEALRYE